MRYAIFLLVLLVGFTHTTHAKRDSVKTGEQYRNTVTLSMANFSIVGITPFDERFVLGWIANQFGINVAHRLDNNLALNIGYHAWNISPVFYKGGAYNDPEPFNTHTYDNRYTYGERNHDDVGSLRFRYGYKMVDATIMYRYDKILRHKFAVGAGLSCAWGSNLYVRYKLYYGSQPNDFLFVMNRERKGYAGILLPVRYDYLFSSGKFGIGLQSNARKYFGLQSLQIDYGFHFSVNF